MTTRRSRAGVFLLYFLTAAISLIAFILANKIWHADLRVPFSYTWYGDAIEPQMKFLLDGGWFFEPRLAAPFGQHSQEFAQLNTIKWAVRWVLVEVTRNPMMSLNLFELLDPILASLTFLYAARRLGLAFAAAIPCAILYGNLFMLYWRVLAGHGIQSAYWMTPLACLALLQIARGMPLVKEGTRFALTRDGAVFVATAVLIGLESHYEVFFFGCLAVVALLIGSIEQRNYRPLQGVATFFVAMVLAFAVNASPQIEWKLTHHEQAYVYSRSPIEAYLYSLSIGQMVLPNPDHRFIPWRVARQQLDDVFPQLSNENRSATLGVIGTVGFCLLMLALIGRAAWRIPKTIEHGALLSLAGFLVATTGGLGAIFNTFVNADIHAYNRISTWIAFFCFITVAFVLERFWDYLRNRNLAPAYFAFAAMLAILGVLDQSPAHPPPYAESREKFYADRAWTRQMEAATPAGTAVLQLPYTDDVESLEARKQDVPYIFSSQLSWSVGGFRYTDHAGFENWLASLPPSAMVAAALLSGFDGILVYHDGYDDRGKAIIAGLQTVTGKKPLTSDDGTQTFFPVADLVSTARAADPSVGTPQGIDEAVAIYQRKSLADLRRIESVLEKRARAAAAGAERLGV